MTVQLDLSFSARNYDFVPYVDGMNWIGGQWQPSVSGERIDVSNPRHGRVMGTVCLSGAEDVELAVSAANKVLPAWRETPLRERVQVLYRLKQLMERDLDELAWLLSHENGKVFNQAKASISKGIECIEFGAALSNAQTGGRAMVSRGVRCEMRQEPLGVVGGVVPFNFPMMVPLWMIPNALAAGNAFILKPSEQVPFGMMKLAALLKEAGLPDGLFSLVHGTRDAVEALVDHPKVKAIAFVGSSKVAKLLYERGAKLGKRMLCLGGAKNHLLVVPDADVELTASNVVASAFGSVGQRCMAASVLVAVGDVQVHIDAIVEKAKALIAGKDFGSVISEAARDRIVGYVDGAEKLGAKVIVDGRGLSVEGCGGFFVGPTILDACTPEMPAAREEIFGPVLSIVRVESIDEGLAIENANPYGNAASIYTTSGDVADYCVSRFEAGMCGVNIGVPVPREPFAFGGWNNSKFGHGDVTGESGYLFWSRARKVTEKWALQKDQNWMN